MPGPDGRGGERQLRGGIRRLLRRLPQRVRVDSHAELHIRHQSGISRKFKYLFKKCGKLNITLNHIGRAHTPLPGLARTSTRSAAGTSASSGWTLTGSKSREYLINFFLRENGNPTLLVKLFRPFLCRNANFANRGQCTIDEFDFYNVGFDSRYCV